MRHTVDKEIEQPYMCEACRHFISGLKCRAFDVIPYEIFFKAERHTSVLPGQRGDYTFSTDKPRDVMRVYCDEEV